MTKKNKPRILVVSLDSNSEEFREMTDAEYEEYLDVTSMALELAKNEKEKIRKKEEAIAKLVALGLTEEDLRAMGI